MKSLVIALLSLSLGACAVGNRHEYSKVTPELAVSTKNSVAIGVHDERPYVVSGGKETSFVGLSRGGFGNPFDINTQSAKPLADDMNETLLQAFKRNGVDVKTIQIKPAESDNAARQVLVALGQQRSILLTLSEWKSDTYQNTSLAYDVRLTVLGPNGAVLADKTLKGNENLGGSVMNPPAHAKEVVPVAYRRTLDALLSSPEIQQAIQ